MPLSPYHPKRKLLFYVVGDLNSEVRAKVEAFVSSLASLGSWLNGPPVYVDALDEPEDSSKGDLPIETVGGYLELYTALPPWSLPREIDLQQLGEVKALVTALQDLSRRDSLSFDLELGSVYVGTIMNGEMEKLLAVGLLGEWERVLGV